jgi:hypothetical protein
VACTETRSATGAQLDRTVAEIDGEAGDDTMNCALHGELSHQRSYLASFVGIAQRFAHSRCARAPHTVEVAAKIVAI